jgi:PAS domain S-box-containing protein
MAKLKGPGLLVRVSHLILIQVIFIFSALALVLFHSDERESVAEHFRSQTQTITTAASILINMTKTDSTGILINPQLGAEANRIIRNNQSISNINLIFHDQKSSRDSIVPLAGRSGVFPIVDIDGHSASQLLFWVNNSSNSLLSLNSTDGKSVNYYLKPIEKNDAYLFHIKSDNVGDEKTKHYQAGFIFLLFLTSALISLLIIKLIFIGIKKPLAKLETALEKTAAGEEQYLPEDAGDKDIQGLARAFNKMSSILSEKQKKLSIANRELLKANQSLLESESILTALVDYSPNAILVTDLDDYVIIYNQQAAKDFGFNQTDMLGKSVSSLFTIPVNIIRSKNIPGEYREGQEIICRRRDGGRFPAMLAYTSLGPEGSRPIAMLYFIKNISESQNYQNMILRLDRIASRGKMARDIAHEINNYLAILQGNLELLPMFMDKGDTEKVLKKVAVMKDTVGKISKFTDGLSQFSDENSEFRKEDLNQLVENLIAFLKPQNRFDEILIGTNLSDNLPLVEIDSSQIQLLLVNLIYNASEALANFDGTRWIVISTSLDESQNNICLKVADSGSGIAEENIQKLFVSRFSTKRNGNGLGMITCKNVVDNHKGEISYHTGDESKAIFEIKIPRRKEASDSSSLSQDSEQTQPIEALK